MHLHYQCFRGGDICELFGESLFSVAGAYLLGLPGLHYVRELVGAVHGAARTGTPTADRAVGTGGSPSPLVTLIEGPAAGEAVATEVVR